MICHRLKRKFNEILAYVMTSIISLVSIYISISDKKVACALIILLLIAALLYITAIFELSLLNFLIPAKEGILAKLNKRLSLIVEEVNYLSNLEKNGDNNHISLYIQINDKKEQKKKLIFKDKNKVNNDEIISLKNKI